MDFITVPSVIRQYKGRPALAPINNLKKFYWQ
jgi:hypothetical protein